MLSCRWGVLWLTFKFILFYILMKMLILPCTCWLYHQLFASNNRITEMYKCQVLAEYSRPMLCDGVESGWFNSLAMRARFQLLPVFSCQAYTSLWPSERYRNNVFVNQWLHEFYLNDVYHIPACLKITNPWTAVYIICSSFTYDIFNVLKIMFRVCRCSKAYTR